MKLHIFCVRDRATDQFGTPMFLMSAGHAMRSLADEVNRGDVQNILSQHPEDFEAFELGVFDTDSGMFSTGVPKSLCVLKDLKVGQA